MSIIDIDFDHRFRSSTSTSTSTSTLDIDPAHLSRGGNPTAKHAPSGTANALNAASYGYAYPNSMHISLSPTPSTMGLSNELSHEHPNENPVVSSNAGSKLEMSPSGLKPGVSRNTSPSFVPPWKPAKKRVPNLCMCGIMSTTKLGAEIGQSASTVISE